MDCASLPATLKNIVWPAIVYLSPYVIVKNDSMKHAVFSQTFHGQKIVFKDTTNMPTCIFFIWDIDNIVRVPVLKSNAEHWEYMVVLDENLVDRFKHKSQSDDWDKSCGFLLVSEFFGEFYRKDIIETYSFHAAAYGKRRIYRRMKSISEASHGVE